MINLNLLPKKEREFLKKEKKYQIIIFALNIFLLGMVIIWFNLFQLNKIIQNNISEEKIPMTIEEKFFEKAKQINTQLIIIEQIQNEYFPVSPLLISLAKITPLFSQIKSFTLNKEKKEFEIKGWAKERKDLLEFQDNLEKSELFTDIQIPFLNFLREENIDFEFKGKINL